MICQCFGDPQTLSKELITLYSASVTLASLQKLGAQRSSPACCLLIFRT